jgi:hypothetical protein
MPQIDDRLSTAVSYHKLQSTKIILLERRSYGTKDINPCCGLRKTPNPMRHNQSDRLRPKDFLVVGYCIPLNTRISVEPTKLKSLTYYLVLSSTGINDGPSVALFERAKARKLLAPLTDMVVRVRLVRGKASSW